MPGKQGEIPPLGAENEAQSLLSPGLALGYRYLSFRKVIRNHTINLRSVQQFGGRLLPLRHVRTVGQLEAHDVDCRIDGPSAQWSMIFGFCFSLMITSEPDSILP